MTLPAFSRFLSLEPAERGIVLKAWILLLLSDLALRVGVLRIRPRPTAEGPDDGSSASDDQIASAKRLAWIVGAAARHHLWNMTCLRQALVLRKLLANKGIASSLRMGVTRAECRVDAHAWVEIGGIVVGDPPAAAGRFAPFPLEARLTLFPR